MLTDSFAGYMKTRRDFFISRTFLRILFSYKKNSSIFKFNKKWLYLVDFLNNKQKRIELSTFTIIYTIIIRTSKFLLLVILMPRPVVK